MIAGMPSVNPAGRPPSVFHTHADTSARILEEFTTSEILAISVDPARLDELPTFKAMVLVQIANALSARDNNDNALERERLLDRVVGKPVSRTELTGKNGAPLQINVITGVNAVDAEFVEVVAPAVDESSVDETREPTRKRLKHEPAPGWEARAAEAQAKRDARRAYVREYQRKRRDAAKDNPAS
ncbi:MAG: hypothetical protein WCD70_14885 [Alphaproteobacteria bacterium]